MAKHVASLVCEQS